MATIGVVRETAPGERRVALVPDVVSRMRRAGLTVYVEAGAGQAAMFPDEAYVQAGAVIADAAGVYAAADVVVCVQSPDPAAPRPGQVLVGLLRPASRPEAVAEWAARGVTVVSLDLLPRTLPRAQAMDALSSQASVTGYRAALVAANTYRGYFPMLMTAAGTVKPATVLVLGAGVAGLQAIGTARRLGAVVTGYDVRPETREEIASLGARFLELDHRVEATGPGGYARELTVEERRDQQRELDRRIAGFDVVITTAAVPGRRPPELVTEAALAAMRPGSVVVDTAAGPLGGNVAGSRPGAVTTTESGVTVVGAGDLPSEMPTAASAAYARNIDALLRTMLHDGALAIDTDGDEVHDAVVVCHGGERRHDAQRERPPAKGNAT